MSRETYQIYPEIGLIYYKVSGKTELNRMIALYDAICADPNFDRSYCGVGDWREAETNLTREEVLALAQYVTEHQLSTGNWVSLVDSPMLTAYSQIYSSLVEGQHPLTICCTVSRAAEELGLDLEAYID